VTSRETPLTRDEILAKALAIADAEGLDVLSMRRLARQLGIEAMSLYHHVANKGAILDGLVEVVMREMVIPEPLPTQWRALVTEMFVAFRAALERHPNVLPLLVTRPLNTQGSASYVEAPLAAMAGAGLDPAAVGQLYQTLVAYTVGHALISARRPVVAPDAPVKRDRAAYPATTSAGSAVRAVNEDTFRQALAIIIGGFAGDA